MTDVSDGTIFSLLLYRFHLQSSSFTALEKIVAQLIFRVSLANLWMKKPLPQHSSAQVLFCFVFHVSVSGVWITKQPQTLTKFQKQHQEVKEKNFQR